MPMRVEPACSTPGCRNRRPCSDHPRPTATQRGYDNDWRTASKAFLLANPSCIACGRRSQVVDHDPPHRGDRKAFWDRSRWRPMCKACHNAKHDVAPGQGSRVLR